MSTSLLFVNETGDWNFVWLLLATYVGTSVWLIALFDVKRSSFPPNKKFFWQQLVAHLPLLGALIYLSIGRKQKST